jgi:hypothetical protein
LHSEGARTKRTPDFSIEKSLVLFVLCKDDKKMNRAAVWYMDRR